MVPSNVRVALVQDGSRRHYGLALALQNAGMLERMFTDWYSSPGSIEARAARLLRWVRPYEGERVAGRYRPELDPRPIVSRPRLALKWKVHRRRFRSVLEFYEWQSEEIAKWIMSEDLGAANVGLGFIRNIAPRLLAHFRQRGLITIGDQMIAPAAIEAREARIQAERFPHWLSDSVLDEPHPQDAYERESWKLVDHILAPSDYVRDGLISCGVPARAISQVPYPINDERIPLVDRRSRSGPIHVGFIGSVGLRKGLPYLFETARQVDPKLARFSVVGPLALRPEVVAKHQGNVDVLGPVARTHAPQLFPRFDVFFFPTTCEGSALVLMEAMAAGLPVVTSPNSGTVARHGVEGFIAPYDATEEYASYIQRLARDKELRLTMGAAARERYHSFSLDSYTSAVSSVLRKVVASRDETSRRV